MRTTCRLVARKFKFQHFGVRLGRGLMTQVFECALIWDQRSLILELIRFSGKFQQCCVYLPFTDVHQFSVAFSDANHLPEIAAFWSPPANKSVKCIAAGMDSCSLWRIHESQVSEFGLRLELCCVYLCCTGYDMQ